MFTKKQALYRNNFCTYVMWANEQQRYTAIVLVVLHYSIWSTESLDLGVVTVPVSAPSTLVCESGWIPLTTIPCHCYSVLVLNHTVNWLSAEQECLNFDSRTKLPEFLTDQEIMTFQQTLKSAANAVGARDVPVGLYKSINGTVRHPSDQSTLPTTGLSFTSTMPPGKCGYIFTDGQFLTNSSCMMTVPSLACQMDCGINIPHPPPPTVTPGSSRCNACPTNWINIGGLCYINPVDSSTLVTYSQAVSICQSVGGWLPSFSNINEWQAVVNYAYNIGISGADSWAAPMWLGGTQTGLVPKWNDGSQWIFSYWAPYQPNTNSSCIWWSVGQGNYWSTATDCNVPAVVFCQWYTCSKVFNYFFH